MQILLVSLAWWWILSAASSYVLSSWFEPRIALGCACMIGCAMALWNTLAHSTDRKAAGIMLFAASFSLMGFDTLVSVLVLTAGCVWALALRASRNALCRQRLAHELPPFVLLCYALITPFVFVLKFDASDWLYGAPVMAAFFFASGLWWVTFHRKGEITS